MREKTPWSKRIDEWSNLGFIALIVTGLVWLVSQILMIFWQWGILRFLNGVSHWLIGPIFAISMALWLITIIVESRFNYNSWAKCLLIVAMKCLAFLVGTFVLIALLNICAKYSTGFWQSLFQSITQLVSNLRTPLFMLTISLFILTMVSKSEIVAKWLDGQLGDGFDYGGPVVHYKSIDDLFQ